MELLKCIYLPNIALITQLEWIDLFAGDVDLEIGTHYENIDFSKALKGAICLYPTEEKEKFVEYLVLFEHRTQSFSIRDIFHFPVNYFFHGKNGQAVLIELNKWFTFKEI